MENSRISPPRGLVAIRAEMARQTADALTTMSANPQAAEQLAASLRRTGKAVLLGMGASHAVNRAVEPLYRDLGIEAFAIPLSEQLGQPLPLKGATVIVTSQSGESAEVLRWGQEHAPERDVFGLTMEAGSQLAQMMPSLIGAGGSEHAFAATRSLTITLAQHATVLAQLGADLGPAQAMLESPAQVGLNPALAAMEQVGTIVTSGRRLQGLAEAIALGLVELSRLPCFSLEGGQLRHGPMEMLGPDLGVVMFRGDDATSELVGRLAASAAEAGSPTVVFDASGAAPVAGAVTVPLPKASGLAALFALLPVAQRFMVEFAASRVENVGTPLRSQKVTRIE
jgi:fructoselysine-6-P-deglycase FrlB-like protein